MVLAAEIELVAQQEKIDMILARMIGIIIHSCHLFNWPGGSLH